MTESEFLHIANKTLSCVQDAADDWFEQLDVDIDALRDGNVLTLILNNATHVVVNLQTPLREIWMAGPSGAYHYQYQSNVWIDTRGGVPLLEAIAAECGRIVSQPLTINNCV